MKWLALAIPFFFLSIHGYCQVEAVMMVKGKVVNERNMKPVEAIIIFENLEDGTEEGFARSNPLTGEYSIILTKGKKYACYATAEGYYSVSRDYDVVNLKRYKEEDEQILYLAPVAEMQVVRLNNVFFKDRTAELTAESYKELERFYTFLKVNKKVKVEISSHTDDKGDKTEDLELTQKRAQIIADYVITKGIKADRITVIGYGQSRPMSFNKSKEGREMNNRVEFMIQSSSKK